MKREIPRRYSRQARPARQRALAQFRRWDWSGDEETRRPSAQPSSDVMPRVLAGLRMDRRREEMEILKVWNNSIDPNVAAHAKPVGIRNGTLFVVVDSSAWLSEIVRYRRQEILERLQNGFGPEVIARISFRQG